MAKHLSVPLALALCAAACGDDGQSGADGGHHADSGHDCTEDTRDEEFVAGMSKSGEAGYAFTLVDSNPAPPDKGNNTWTLELADPGGAPVDDVTIEVEPFMPDHGHGTTVPAAVTPMGDGVYELDPVNLFMPGLWEITLRAVDGDDTTLDTVVYKFCVSG